MANILWSSEGQNPKGIVVCPRCRSVIGFDEKDLHKAKTLYKYAGGGLKAIKGYRGFLTCPRCNKGKFEAEYLL